MSAIIPSRSDWSHDGELRDLLRSANSCGMTLDDLIRLASISDDLPSFKETLWFAIGNWASPAANSGTARMLS